MAAFYLQYMYDTSSVIHITKDDVLQKVSEYDIYARYLGFKPVLGALYISPLRNDSNPSFGLFKSKRTGNILFKDLGTGECGDCFKFACLIDNQPIKQILKELYQKNIKKTLPKKPVALPIKEYSTLDIVVDDIKFTAEGLAFWSGFGITEQTLNYFNVKQIKRFWVNGLEYWTATKAKPMFSYFIYSKTRIYRPNFKQKKFYTNCTTVDIQGWEQLDYTKDTVFITKSYKDVMLLYELGYTAVAPNGEGHSIPETALSILRKNFKHIVILYDRDLPGLLASKKLWRQNTDFDFMFMPRRTEKDLSDYYIRFGKENTNKMLLNKLNKT
jgi:hypothetical protein